MLKSNKFRNLKSNAVTLPKKVPSYCPPMQIMKRDEKNVFLLVFLLCGEKERSCDCYFYMIN